MMRSKVLSLGLGVLALAAMSCKAGNNSLGSGGTGGTSSQSTSTSNPGSGGGAQSSSAQFMTGSTGTSGLCNTAPDQDQDGDGWTVAQGDCNDCDKNVSPGALEVVVTTVDPMTNMVPPPVDEDCDGTADNPPAPTCDTGLVLVPGSASDAAKAIELCHAASGPKDWGVVSANFTRADGTTTPVSQQVGIMPTFGTNIPPRAGANLFVLSSGHARTVGQAGACNSCNCPAGPTGTAPPGFPQDNGCGTASDIHDDMALEVKLRAPTNAKGYGFDFRFFTFEYPDYVCSAVNDQFIALVNPPPMGALNGNIAFDNMSNPVSVNIAFFDVCNVPGDPSGCNNNAAQLANTGFDVWSGVFDDGQAGGTTWLHTNAPVTGGQEFTLRFAIWDTGDEYLNSTSIIDNFSWIASGGTVTVNTKPVN